MRRPTANKAAAITTVPAVDDVEAIAAGWDPWLPVRQRAAALGWTGPYDPEQWRLLTANSAAHLTVAPSSDITPEQRRAAAVFGTQIADAAARVDVALAAWTVAEENALAARARSSRIERRTDRDGNLTAEVSAAEQAVLATDVARDAARDALGRARVRHNHLQRARDTAVMAAAAPRTTGR